MPDSETGGETTAPSDPADRFYHGVIFKLFSGKRWGIVQTASGREIPFEFVHLTVLGERCKLDDLREGMRVGYDVSWTSKGLRVSLIRPEE